MILRPGTYLQERYEILEQVGSGGMSVVYKARCHKLNRPVAIKVLKEEFSNDSTFVGKFKMEAQAAARLSHPNIVNVYDVIDEGKLHYIVMELIEGVTLKTYITRKGRLEIKESIGIAIQVASGIAAAHEQHIIHRDIKPQNMIVSRDGKVKVADFGIARGVSTQTMNSAAMGSVHYISPEQARGGYSDERSDIYSLGITMYEMVTGRLPYEGENTVAIALSHLEEPMVPPSAYNKDIPVSLEKIILKCTAKKPENRYGNANELMGDLRRSLTQPDGAFVQDTDNQRALSGQTVQISGKDLARIKEQYTPVRDEPIREYAREEPVREYNREESAREYVRRPAKEAAASRYPSENRRTSEHHSQRKQEPEDPVNSHIERLLAGAGIVVAIIIVAVLIVVFSRLGGLLKFSSDPPTAEIYTETVKPEETLSDMEVEVPDVLEHPCHAGKRV